MEHNGNIKQVLYLIEKGFTESFEDDDSVKPVFFEENVDIIKLLSDLKYKLDSYDITDGSVEYRKGAMFGINFSSELIGNLINKLGTNNE